MCHGSFLCVSFPKRKSIHMTRLFHVCFYRTEEEAKKMVEIADYKKNGVIEYDEFIELMSSESKVSELLLLIYSIIIVKVSSIVLSYEFHCNVVIKVCPNFLFS